MAKSEKTLKVSINFNKTETDYKNAAKQIKRIVSKTNSEFVDIKKILNEVATHIEVAILKKKIKLLIPIKKTVEGTQDWWVYKRSEVKKMNAYSHSTLSNKLFELECEIKDLRKLLKTIEGKITSPALYPLDVFLSGNVDSGGKPLVKEEDLE